MWPVSFSCSSSRPTGLAGGCFLHASSCLHLSCITLAHLLATANNWSISTDTLMSYIWYAKGLQWSIKYQILLFFIYFCSVFVCTAFCTSQERKHALQCILHHIGWERGIHKSQWEVLQRFGTFVYVFIEIRENLAHL